MRIKFLFLLNKNTDMYNLIIDAGNTIIKLRVLMQKEIVSTENCKDWDSALNSIKLLQKNFKISACILSNVRESNALFENYITKNFKTIFFSHTNKLPVIINYKSLETLGKDRLAAVCGASELFPNKNSLIIDAGTAITYDILKDGKIYEGGNISPGIKIRFKALNTFTKKLPLIDIDAEDNNLFGQNTEQAIRYGVQNGILHEVKGVIEDFKLKYSDLNIIFTGGDSFFFEKLLNFRIFAEPNLTTLGLNKILELNA